MKFEAKSVGRMRIPPDKVIKLDSAHLRGEDLSGRRIIQFSAVGSRLEDCRFDGARIDNASFGAGKATSEYVRCSFDGVRINFGPGGYARFFACTFRDAKLSNWFCFAVELGRCEFSGLIRKSVFNGTVPKRHRTHAGRERNEFRDNDFSQAELIDVSFRTGIDLSRQRLPSGKDYLYVQDAESVVDRAYAEVSAWQDDGLRSQAMGLIRTLQRTVDGGQQQLLLCESDFVDSARISGKAARAVFELLRNPMD